MGFFDAFNDTGQLLKNTFVVIRENPAILRPTITQLFWGLILYTIIIVGIAASFLTTGPVQFAAVLSVIFSVIILFIFFPFVKVYYRAAQCWIVYNTFSGKNASYKDGLMRADKNKGDIFIIGLVDIILNAVANKLKGGTGRGGAFIILNLVMWVIGKVIQEGWDLIGHYILPASIIQDKKVHEVLPEIPNIKKNVPGALAGVFGIDFVGDVIRGYITGLMALFLFVGGLAWYFYGTWVPLLIIIIILLGINIVMKVFIEMVKNVYFTLFYMSVTMPNKIDARYREEVTHYLLHHKLEDKKAKARR